MVRFVDVVLERVLEHTDRSISDVQICVAELVHL